MSEEQNPACRGYGHREPNPEGHHDFLGSCPNTPTHIIRGRFVGLEHHDRPMCPVCLGKAAASFEEGLHGAFVTDIGRTRLERFRASTPLTPEQEKETDDFLDAHEEGFAQGAESGRKGIVAYLRDEFGGENATINDVIKELEAGAGLTSKT